MSKLFYLHHYVNKLFSAIDCFTELLTGDGKGFIYFIFFQTF